MADDAKQHLDEMLSRYNDQIAKRDQSREEAARVKAAADEEAQQYVREVLLPALQPFVDRLKAEGHSASAYEEPQACRITLFPKGATRGGVDRPFLKFSVGREKVLINGSNILPGRGGSGGERTSYAREDFTTQMLESEVLKWIDEVLFGPWR